MNTKVKCRECGEMISREEAIKCGNEFLCESCFNDSYTICVGCGRVINILETVNINRNRDNEKFVCDLCAEKYPVCSCCGEHISSDAIWASDDNMTICYNCNFHYSICDDCGAIVHENNIYYCENDGNHYCEECYDEHNYNSYIEDYCYKPEPVFLGYSEENLYLGVELEIDKGNNIYQTTKALYDKFEDIYLKHDGSLSDSGFEIVSHPATLEHHTSDLGWDSIMELCKSNGFRSHDTSTCGLHIHLSRTFLGENETEQDLNIAKLIILFDKWWEQYIVPFSRRDISNIVRWADKPSLDCLNTDTERDIVDKVKSYKSAGRYKAINLENENTIEFRLFRGTLNFNTFIASLQFVVEITKFAKSVKLNDIFTSKWSDIFLCTEFKELKEYLIERKLLKEEN